MANLVSLLLHVGRGMAVEHTDTQGTSQLPLAMLGEGETARIVQVKGASELRQHLATLGFVEGAEVTVASRVNGDVIVSVKGARLGLNRQMSSHIMVTL